jgi:hypothetical protein
MVSKYSDEDRRAILRDLLANRPPPYEPAVEPLYYKRHEATPEPDDYKPKLDTRAAAPSMQPDDPWREWETWVSARIATALAAERETLIAAMVEIMAQSMADFVGDQHDEWRAEMHRETAKLTSALEMLNNLVVTELRANKATPIDLPSLPLHRRN